MHHKKKGDYCEKSVNSLVVIIGIFAFSSYPGVRQYSHFRYGRDFSDVPPQVIEGRTRVPIQTVAEALIANVNWNE